MIDSGQAWKTNLGHSRNRRVGSPAPIRRHTSPVLRTQSQPTRQRLALTPARALHKSGFLNKPNWQPYRSISEISTEHTTKSKPEVQETYRHTYQDSPTGTTTQRTEDTGYRTPKL